jgi:hypothetical protein
MLQKISFIFFFTLTLSACSKNFGLKKEFGNLEVFYTKDIPIEYVDGVGQYFKDNDLILDHQHSIKLTSNQNSFILKMILNQKYDSLPAPLKHDLKLLEDDIHQKVFADLNFKIEICDANFYPLNLKH